jgi:hypothetical protein
MEIYLRVLDVTKNDFDKYAEQFFVVLFTMKL